MYLSKVPRDKQGLERSGASGSKVDLPNVFDCYITSSTADIVVNRLHSSITCSCCTSWNHWSGLRIPRSLLRRIWPIAKVRWWGWNDAGSKGFFGVLLLPWWEWVQVKMSRRSINGLVGYKGLVWRLMRVIVRRILGNAVLARKVWTVIRVELLENDITQFAQNSDSYHSSCGCNLALVHCCYWNYQ